MSSEFVKDTRIKTSDIIRDDLYLRYGNGEISFIGQRFHNEVEL